MPDLIACLHRPYTDRFNGSMWRITFDLALTVTSRIRSCSVFTARVRSEAMAVETRTSEEVLAAREKRHWANGAASSLYELLAEGYKDTVGFAGVLRIRAVVVDADVLLKVTAQVKRPGQIKLYDESCSGPLRIFVAETIPSEVDRNMSRVCREAGVDEGRRERRGVRGDRIFASSRCRTSFLPQR